MQKEKNTFKILIEYNPLQVFLLIRIWKDFKSLLFNKKKSLVIFN